jgi:hypothetical protein
MKLYLAGLPDLYGHQKEAFEHGGARNFLVSYARPKNAEDYVKFLNTCPCGKPFVRVGNHNVCPDKLDEIISSLEVPATTRTWLRRELEKARTIRDAIGKPVWSRLDSSSVCEPVPPIKLVLNASSRDDG